MFSSKLVAIAMAVAVAMLAACSDETGGAGAQQSAAVLLPAEPALTAIYNRSCRNCHTIAATYSHAGPHEKTEINLHAYTHSRADGSGGGPQPSVAWPKHGGCKLERNGSGWHPTEWYEYGESQSFEYELERRRVDQR